MGGFNRGMLVGDRLMAGTLLSCTERCIRAGFKFGNTGPHNSRTMMLEEIARCLDVLPPDAKRADYRTVLAKKPEKTAAIEKAITER